MEWRGFSSAGGYSYQASASSSTGFKTGTTQKKPQKNVQKTQNREMFMEKVEVWVCKICDKDYGSKSSLNRHFATAHEQPKPKPVAQPKAFAQSVSDIRMEWRGFSSAGGYSYQASASSSAGFKTGTTQKKPQKNVQKTQNREMFMEKVEVWVCKICDKDYGSKSSLNRHFAMAHEQPIPQQGFFCRHCGGEYSTQGNLNRHVSTVHEKPKANIAVSKSTKVVQKNKTNITINVYNPVGFNDYNRRLY